LPVSRRIFSEPMCSGRSMYFEPASLALRAHRRPEIDRHRRDDRRGQQRDEHREAEADVAEQRVAARRLSTFTE
jgi:hypothetical protein